MARRLIGLLVHGDAVKGLVRKTNKERKAAPATNSATAASAAAADASRAADRRRAAPATNSATAASAAAAEASRAADRREAGDKGKRKASNSLASDADADGGGAPRVVDTMGASSTASSTGESKGNAQTAAAGAARHKKHKGSRSAVTAAPVVHAPSAAGKPEWHEGPAVAPDSDDDFVDLNPHQSHRPTQGSSAAGPAAWRRPGP